MKITTATATVADLGPLTRLVFDYCNALASRATASGSKAADWDALTQYIAVDEFKRIGAYMEVMNWREYVQFLTAWAGTTRFEMTIHRISEIGNLVIQEIEERHYKGGEFIRKNVVAIYEFNDAKEIRVLHIYEQAKDTGRWIVDAAHAVTK